MIPWTITGMHKLHEWTHAELQWCGCVQATDHITLHVETNLSGYVLEILAGLIWYQHLFPWIHPMILSNQLIKLLIFRWKRTYGQDTFYISVHPLWTCMAYDGDHLTWYFFLFCHIYSVLKFSSIYKLWCYRRCVQILALHMRDGLMFTRHVKLECDEKVEVPPCCSQIHDQFGDHNIPLSAMLNILGYSTSLWAMNICHNCSIIGQFFL